MLQATKSQDAGDLVNFRREYAEAVKDLYQIINNLYGKNTSNGINESVKKLAMIGKGHQNIFNLRERHLKATTIIEKKIEQAHQIAFRLRLAAQSLSSQIIDSAHATSMVIRRSTQIGTWASIGLVLVSALLAALIGWRVVILDIVRRISALRVKMIEGQMGKLDLKINTRGKDEIADMARAFEYFVDHMRIDIQARKQSEMHIRDAMKRAEAASEAKSAFLANMSHEIRTPMNSIIGNANLALYTVLTPEQMEFIESIRVSANHLLGVINDILDFSKIEAGYLELEEAQFNCKSIMADAMNTMDVRAREKNLVIIRQIEKDLPEFVIGDPGRLRQVVVNLLSNAVKFTQTGQIILTCQITDKFEDAVKLQISVSDSGIGIPSDKLNAIFDVFEQADNSTTRNYGGTGLGLSISKQLVEMMGGRMWVESPRTDLRIDPEIRQAEACFPSTALLSGEGGPGSTFFFTVKLGLPSADDKLPEARACAGSPRLLRLCIVGDRSIGEMNWWKLLPDAQVTCDDTPNGHDALKVLEDAVNTGAAYDAVLVKRILPDMEGSELCRRIRTNPILSDIVFILVTPSGMKEDPALCKKVGADGYLVKPVSLYDLFDVTMMALNYSSTNVDQHEIPVVTQQMVQDAHQPIPLNILLVEDNDINRKMTKKILESNGHDVILSKNGKQALDRLQSNSFDMVLMDVQMPVMDGITATHVIRNTNRSYRDIPIVAMTAHAMKGDKEKCINAGMDDYIAKPIDPDKLLCIISKIAEQEQIDTKNAIQDHSPY